MNIVGGINIHSTESKFPSVIKLKFSADDHKPHNCTGTFITKKMILTAAHCFKDVHNKEGLRIDILDARDGNRQQILETVYSMSQVTIREGYNPWNKIRDEVPRDLALIKLRTSQYEHYTSSPISFETHQRKDLVYLVGYGGMINLPEKKTKGPYIKRYGKSKISRFYSDRIIVYGQFTPIEGRRGEWVGLAGGDSGGPLFNEFSQVIGVASYADFDDEYHLEYQHNKLGFVSMKNNYDWISANGYK